MTTFLLALVIFAVLFAGMAIGLIFQNKPLKGSCGGLNQFTGGECEICGGDPNKCESESKETDQNRQNKASALARDASK